MYNLIIRLLLFCIDPEKVHRMLLSWLKFYRYLFPVRACVRGYSRVSDPFSYGHLQFKNRIGLSAGFDKNAEAFDELADFGFGFLEVGTVTPDSQSGNPSPRIFRLVDDESLISRTGFNNCGVDAVRQHIRKYRKHSYVLGVNINKNPLSTGDQIIKDFESTFIHLYDCVDYFTLNWGSIDNDLFAMPMLKKENIGAINWGLVAGKTNTIYAWDTPLLDVSEPLLWFHDIFRSDGTPYSAEEVECIRSLTK